MTKTIKLIVSEKIRRSDGQKFKTYHVIDKDGKRLDVRFTKEVDRPDKTCMMTFESTDANVSLAREYPVLWVQKAEFFPIEITNNIDDYI